MVIKEMIIDPVNKFVCFGFSDLAGLNPFDGVVATLEFTLAAGAPDQIITIDSGFFAPAGDFILTKSDGNSLYPQFASGTITVSQACDNYPIITTCPGGNQLVGDHCGVVEYQFEAVNPLECGDLNCFEVIGGGVINCSGFFTFQGESTGTYPVTVIVSNTLGGRDSCMFDVVLTNMGQEYSNCPASPIPFFYSTYPQGLEYNLYLNNFDCDSIEENIAISFGPNPQPVVSPEINDGVFTWTPYEADYGSWGFEITADDGQDPYNQTAICEIYVDVYVYPSDFIDTIVIDSADLYYIQAADLDRNNYMDIIYTGSIATGLFVSYGNSADTLSDPVNNLDINQASIAVGYINIDSLLDIVAVDSANIYVLLNQGDSTFNIDSISLNRSSGIPSLALGYINDDSYLDIISAPDNLHIGDGSGEFAGMALPFSFESVNTADFDYDGNDDLLITGDDSVKIYLNDGFGSFSQTASEYTLQFSLEIPPSSAVTDFNRDQNADFAMVQPLADPYTGSGIYIGLGDGSGGILQFSGIAVDGDAYNLVVTDVNRDNEMDIVISNGTNQRLEIYNGDGTGGFGMPAFVALPSGDDMTLVLATLDLNRDGNPDYLCGGPDGDNLIAAIDQHPGTTESLDEMVVSGYNGINLEIINPAGFVLSRNFQTIAGADYWVYDINSDSILDEESYDYNLMYGDYTIIIRPGTSGEVGYFDAGVRIDGSVKAIIFDDYNVFGVSKRDFWNNSDSIVFYYPIESQPSVSPYNGQTVGDNTPTFNWSGMVDQGLIADSFYFQISNYHDFRDTIEDSIGILDVFYTTKIELDTARVYYWRIQPYQGGFGLEFSHAFAIYITSYLCGDSNSDGTVNVSDAVNIINYVFVGGNPPNPMEAGDCNCDDTCNISDAVGIINYVFVGGNPPCDMDGDDIPDC